MLPLRRAGPGRGGDQVRAEWGGAGGGGARSSSFVGTITTCHRDGTYTVAWADGDRPEAHIPRERIERYCHHNVGVRLARVETKVSEMIIGANRYGHTVPTPQSIRSFLQEVDSRGVPNEKKLKNCKFELEACVTFLEQNGDPTGLLGNARGPLRENCGQLDTWCANSPAPAPAPEPAPAPAPAPAPVGRRGDRDTITIKGDVLTLIELDELCRLSPGYRSGWQCDKCHATRRDGPLFHAEPGGFGPGQAGLDCCVQCATWHGYRAGGDDFGGGGGGGGGF
jgi:hypothetical protein